MKCTICNSISFLEVGSSELNNKVKFKNLVKILRESSTFDFRELKIVDQNLSRICPLCDGQLEDFEVLVKKLLSIQDEIDTIKDHIRSKALQSQLHRKCQKDLMVQSRGQGGGGGQHQMEIEYIQIPKQTALVEDYNFIPNEELFEIVKPPPPTLSDPISNLDLDDCEAHFTNNGELDDGNQPEQMLNDADNFDKKIANKYPSSEPPPDPLSNLDDYETHYTNDDGNQSEQMFFNADAFDKKVDDDTDKYPSDLVSKRAIVDLRSIELPPDDVQPININDQLIKEQKIILKDKGRNKFEISLHDIIKSMRNQIATQVTQSSSENRVSDNVQRKLMSKNKKNEIQRLKLQLKVKEKKKLQLKNKIKKSPKKPKSKPLLVSSPQAYSIDLEQSIITDPMSNLDDYEAHFTNDEEHHVGNQPEHFDQKIANIYLFEPPPEHMSNLDDYKAHFTNYEELDDGNQSEQMLLDSDAFHNKITNKYPDLVGKRARVVLRPIELPPHVQSININDQLIRDHIILEKLRDKGCNEVKIASQDKITTQVRTSETRVLEYMQRKLVSKNKKNKIQRSKLQLKVKVKKAKLPLKNKIKKSPKKPKKPKSNPNPLLVSSPQAYSIALDKSIITDSMLILEGIVKLNVENGSSIEEIQNYLTQVHNFNNEQNENVLENVGKLVKKGKLQEFKSDQADDACVFKITDSGLHVKVKPHQIKVDTLPPPVPRKKDKNKRKEEDEEFHPYSTKPKPKGKNEKPLNSTLNFCTICNVKFIRDANFEVHMSKHTDECPYICIFCDIPYSCRKRLRHHIKSHGIGPCYETPCDKCPELIFFANKSEYDCHMRIHLREEEAEAQVSTLLCEICSKTDFVSVRKFKKHIRSHSKNRSNKCPIVGCDKVYREYSYLSSHIRHEHKNHPREKFECGFCCQSYYSRHGLRNHIKYIHEKQKREKNAICNICSKGFLSIYSLKAHKWTVHEKIRPFKCSYCERSFSDKSNRLRHEQMHRNERKFLCQFCSHSFIVKRSLRIHIEKNHPEEAQKL